MGGKQSFFRLCMSKNLFTTQNSFQQIISLDCLQIFLHFLLGSTVAVEKSKDILIPDPLFMTCFFFLSRSMLNLLFATTNKISVVVFREVYFDPLFWALGGLFQSEQL